MGLERTPAMVSVAQWGAGSWITGAWTPQDALLYACLLVVSTGAFRDGAVDYSMLVQVIRQPFLQFIEHILLRRGVDALMAQCFLCFANIALSELRADEAPEVVGLDSLNLFRYSMLSSSLRHRQHPTTFFLAHAPRGRSAGRPPTHIERAGVSRRCVKAKPYRALRGRDPLGLRRVFIGRLVQGRRTSMHTGLRVPMVLSARRCPSMQLAGNACAVGAHASLRV